MRYDINQEFTVRGGYPLSARDKAMLARGEAIADVLAGIGHAIKGVLGPVVARVQNWAAEQATRDELMALDERTLADIGLTRGDIPRVAAGLWVPENRLAQVHAVAPKSPSNVNRPQIAA